jgi:hypothetical protein
MKPWIVALCALFAGLTATAGAQMQGQIQAPAQARGSFTMQCDPLLVGYLFSSTQTITTYLCSTNATINGVAFKGLTFSDAGQCNSVDGAMPTACEDWGVFVGALANGDQVFFQYQATSRRAGTATSGTMSYKIVGGTGSANGISGSGNCNSTGTVGKETVRTCSGTYALR